MEKITEDIHVVMVSPIQANCYIIECGEGNVVVIDPGDDYKKIKNYLDKKKFTVVAILITHGHYDHMGVAKKMSEDYSCEIYMGKQDDKVLSFFYDWSIYLNDKCVAFEKFHPLNDGDVLIFGNKKFKCIHSPGHSPGSISFQYKNYVFSGDVIFAGGGYGRTDLGGSYNDLLKTLSKLLKMPDDTIFLTGHGPKTSLVREKVFYE